MKLPASLLPAILALSVLSRADEAPKFVEGEAIVIFKKDRDLAGARRVLEKRSLKFERHFSRLSNKRRQQAGLVNGGPLTTAALIEQLRNDPAVETAEPNYLRTVKAAPNDTSFSSLWALQNTGQPVNGTSGTAGSDIKFVQAWKLARPETPEVVVGVIDTGIDRHHPDLLPNLWTNDGEIPFNGIDDDSNGLIDDYHGANLVSALNDLSDSGDHGTHVAGTVAVTGNNHLGVIGANSRASIMALKVSTDGDTIDTAAVIEALEYAIMMKSLGVNIVALNASYAGGGFSTAERNAIEDAGEAGIILCAAAGNESANNDAVATYPANYRLPNMIVVAASDQNDALASFSNRGATKVDLAAPGSNILSTQAGVISVGLQVGGTSYSASALTHSGITAGISGNIVFCGIGNVGEFPSSVSGNVALIERGTLTFEEKATRAMAAGATAVVIYNNVAGTFLGTLGNDKSWVPVVGISQADGLSIKNGLPQSATVTSSRSAGYHFLNGTSMATPQVAAAVSFAAMNFPSESVSARIARILNSVDVNASLQGKMVTGGRLNLLRTVDADANALPDWWEQDHFNLANGIDPAFDADSDGQSNLAEFQAGTDPADSSSSLNVLAAGQTGAPGTFTITWASVPGKTYQIEHSPSLVPQGWLSNLPASLITAAPGQTQASYTDTTANSAASRFYRVQAVEP